MTSTEPRIDPALAALADAILIPPFSGTTPPPWILRALERGLAGVTLFGPNVVGDTAALSAALRSAAAVEPVIAIDEEGGDVTRVAYAEGSPYPGNAALGVVDDVALTRDVYAAIGGDLARVGINLNLAPCADMLVPGGSAVVGTRSFGSDPVLVARTWWYRSSPATSRRRCRPPPSPASCAANSASTARSSATRLR
jgi:beta-N-acetylhexosaminidase